MERPSSIETKIAVGERGGSEGSEGVNSSPPAPPGELINSPDCKVSGYLIKWTNKWRLPSLSWVTNREIRPEIWLRTGWIWAVTKQLYSTSWNDCHSARQAVAAVARKLIWDWLVPLLVANNTRTAFQLSDFRFRFRVWWPGRAGPSRAGEVAAASQAGSCRSCG